MTNTGLWGSPAFIVYSHGKARMVCDFRELNELLADHPCPLPQIKGLFMEFADAQFWCTLDMAQGYYQIELDESSQPVHRDCVQVWNKDVHEIANGCPIRAWDIHGGRE